MTLVNLDDKYCSICCIEHDQSECSLKILPDYAYLDCNKDLNKMVQMVQMVRTGINYNIQLIQINNYNGVDDDIDTDSIVPEQIFENNKFNKLMYNSLEGTHYRIAEVLHYKYNDLYRCKNYKDNTWYEFRNHRWKEGIHIKYEINKGLILDYKKMLNIIMTIKN